jgi:hypothetical protein
MERLNYSKISIVLDGFVAFVVLGGIELANGATITVGPGAGCDFDTIQAGIDVASDGDTVLVASGEYVITEPITFRGKAITVKSESGADETTIRMGTPTDINRGSVVVFENGEAIAAVLDGFTITGGRGSLVDSEEAWIWGGGILFNASSGIVRNCTIEQNSADHCGGGLCCVYDSSVAMNNCIISENSATVESGGGVICWDNSSVTMTQCFINRNSAGNSGGGVFCGQISSGTMTACIISDNFATLSAGGVFCYKRSSLAMTDCIVKGNTADHSCGGVKCHKDSSRATLTCCAIIGNTTQKYGGGLVIGGGSATITNCVIATNAAAEEEGGGLFCWNGSATVTNSIFWGNTAPIGPGIWMGKTPTFIVSYSNVAGGKAGVDVQSDSTLTWGEGNIDTDPFFVRIGYWDDNGTRSPSDDVWVDGDYHLRSEAGRWNSDSQTWVQDDVTSPCIDAGDPMSAIGWESFPNGGFVNMGTYGGTSKASKSYFGEPTCETIVAGDINGDGQVNRADLEIMALHWTDDEPLPLP